MKLGAVLIPASLQLTKKDIIYRAQSAGVEMVVCVDDDYVIDQMEQAFPECPTIANRVVVAGSREGWLQFDELIAKYPEARPRPTGDAAAGGR